MSCRGHVSHLATVPVSNPVRFYIVHCGAYYFSLLYIIISNICQQFILIFKRKLVSSF